MKFFKKILTCVLTGAMMCGMLQAAPAGYGEVSVAEAAGAVNILNYESNKSASEYAIYDVAGMEKLAELVNENRVTLQV